MNMIVRLSEEIAPMFHESFNSMATHQIDKGGRGSTKTSKNALKIAKQMMKDAECNTIVVRRYFKDHRQSTYQELKRAFGRLGVNSKQLELRTSPMSITYKKNGNKVYFAGLDDYENLKGMIPDEKKFKIIWFFEITQFKDDYDMNQVIATFSRGNPDYFINLYEFNPHPNSSHWSYDWVDRMATRQDCIVNHTTYLDLPDNLQRSWLGKFFLQEAEAIKELDYEQYKSIYLGLKARLEGALYKKFKSDIHTSKIEDRKHLIYTIGVDYGETDATVFVFEGLKQGLAGLDVISEYYHKNKPSDEKDINDYVDDFIDFANDCFKSCQRPIQVWVDSANKSFSTLIKKKCAMKQMHYLSIKAVNKKKKRETSLSAIEERIQLTNLMLGYNDFLTIDKSCKHLIQALEEAERDKDGNRKDDGSTNIDSLDAYEYGHLNFYEQLRNAVIMRKDLYE